MNDRLSGRAMAIQCILISRLFESHNVQISLGHFVWVPTEEIRKSQNPGVRIGTSMGCRRYRDVFRQDLSKLEEGQFDSVFPKCLERLFSEQGAISS